MDSFYRALLRLLPRDLDRPEMWDTYRARVGRARDTKGGIGATRERVAETLDLLTTLISARWPLPSLDSLGQDVRVGLRSLRHAPLASGLAVLSLALGVGATTAIFSAVDVWLLRPLPLPNAERLVGLWRVTQDGRSISALSPPDYQDLARASNAVEPMVYAPTDYNMALDGRAERVRGLVVSANGPGVLGIVPALGRTFDRDEGTEAGAYVALLSQEFWTRAFGADPNVVGRAVILDEVPHTVVGILRSGQTIPGEAADVWTPLRLSGSEARSGRYLRSMALLPQGMDIGKARTEMDAVAASISEATPEAPFPGVRLRTAREHIYGTEAQLGSNMIGGAALFVLLIACANIANILLARGLGRRHELAVRGALGAGRRRLAQQLFVEAVILGVLGGALGILVGRVGIDLLVAYVLPPDVVPGRELIALNGRVLTGACVLTGGSLLLFGLLPSLRASSVPLGSRLAEGGRGAGTAPKSGLDSILMVGEIAATLTLVTLTALTFDSFATLRGVDMGMRTTDALVFRVDLPPTSPPNEAGVRSMYRDLRDRLEALPGVSEVATSSGHIVSFWSSPLYSIPGRMPEGTVAAAERRAVTTSYRTVMQLQMVAGRWFDDAVDVAGGTPVAVVSEALARRWWDEPADALGQTIRCGEQSRQIVGVVDPGRLRGPLVPSPPAIFDPFSQTPARSTFNVLVHSMDEAQAAAAVHDVVADVSPGLAVFGVATIEAQMYESVGPVASGLQLFGAMALLGLVLTLGGVYGVVAHSVGRRTREMGLRMALGARGGQVVRMMVWRSAKLAAVGIVIGLALSVASGRGMAILIYGVSPGDPRLLFLVATLVAAVVIGASYLPARRAALVDPVRALRAQ